jgi:hypothetical protein
MTELRAVWADPEQAGKNFAHVVRPFCHEQWKAGRRLVVTIRELEDERSLQQNAFYWSFVLKNISQQATINGIGSDAYGWHYWFKKNILGYCFTKTKVPGSKRPVIRRELRSTTKLSVSKMSKYLEQVMAHAATTYGVAFEDGKRWQDWQV